MPFKYWGLTIFINSGFLVLIRVCFIKFLRGIYEKYITKSRFSVYQDKIKDETEEFNLYLKSFLKYLDPI